MQCLCYIVFHCFINFLFWSIWNCPIWIKHFVTIDVRFGGIKNYCKSMIDLTSSSPVSITSVVNFCCSLFFNFKYTAFFLMLLIKKLWPCWPRFQCLYIFSFWRGIYHSVILFHQLVFIIPLEMKLLYCFLIFLISN